MDAQLTRRVPRGLLYGVAVLLAASAAAQLTDLTQTPNAEDEGIRKSLAEQIGAGRGDVITPGSSIFIIERDPFRSIRRGRQLFQRKFTIAQGLGPRDRRRRRRHRRRTRRIGAGLADSCAACHGRPRGSAGFGGDVFTRPDSRDAPHLFGLGLQEMLADEITARPARRLRATAIDEAQRPPTARVTRRASSSKGIDYGQLTAFAERHRRHLARRGRRRRPARAARSSPRAARSRSASSWSARSTPRWGSRLPDPLISRPRSEARGRHARRAWCSTARSTTSRRRRCDSPTDDGDGDGVVNEIDPALIDHMEFYLLNYFKPGRRTRATSFTDDGLQAPADRSAARPATSRT